MKQYLAPETLVCELMAEQFCTSNAQIEDYEKNIIFDD